MIFAARLMQDASPTDVPPNFITCNRLFISSFASADKFTPTVVDALLSLPPLQTLYRRGLLASADMATFFWYVKAVLTTQYFVCKGSN